MEYNVKRLKELFQEESTITDVAKKYAKEEGVDYTDSIRRRVSKKLTESTLEKIDDDLENDTETNTNQYKNTKDKKPNFFTAIGDDGKMMDIKEFCEHYKLEIDKIKSWKLVSHTGIPFYNIAFYESVIESQVSLDEIKTIIEEELGSISKSNRVNTKSSGTGVVKIADLHFGSYVDNLIRTKDFSIGILAEKLIESAKKINERNYQKVHVHILGDLIESFTGLNHKNTWKGLDKGMVGAEAVKLCCKMLHEYFLSEIDNLDEVKVIGGNHDRVTSDNKEDVQGGAADLISWGLTLIGYNVEFNPLVITHTIDGICHILTHGHFSLSKKSTKQLCWDYGEKGKFNLICEGHLHSIIQKLSVSQREKFQTIKDDAVDHRRMNCPSFFTGNFFSESLGYTSESGFVIVEDNGRGVPNVFYYAV